MRVSRALNYTSSIEPELLLIVSGNSGDQSLVV